MHAPQTDIILRHGNVELARMTLPLGEYTIGRDRNSQIFVNTPLLSRRHARLTIEEERLLIEDLGSSNGTFINDQPVTGARPLLPNQGVRLGDVHLEIRRQAHVESNANPFRPAPTVVAKPVPAPKPVQPAAQPAASPAAKRPAAPADAPRAAPRKSKVGLYGGIGAGLIALGVAAFFLWARPEKLTRAQLYALAHPTGEGEPTLAATPAMATAAPAARSTPQNAPHTPAAGTSPKPVAKSATEKTPPPVAKNATPPQQTATKPDETAPAPEKTGDSPEDLAADAKALAEAKQKRLDLIAKFQFAEARTAVMDPALKTEKARDEQELLAKKATWLANFKSQLIEDLNAKGYAQPVTRKSGERLPGGVARADDQQVTLRSPHVAVPWTELSLDSIDEMGRFFIPPDMPPEIAAFRKWHLGVFAFYAGNKKEGLDLLHEAAQIRRVFKDELPLFEKDSGPY